MNDLGTTVDLSDEQYEAVADYLDALAAGQPLDPIPWLDQHPRVAPELRQFLDDQASLAGFTPPWGKPRLASFGKYRVSKFLGQGGVGEVFLAWDNTINRELVIKVLRTDHLDKEKVVQRFVREAELTAQMAHPSIVPIYDVGRTDQQNRPYIAMMRIHGQTLADLLDEVRQGPAPLRDYLLEPFKQVCLAVAYAHSRNLLHRDLKPANVMLAEIGQAMVVDWGISKVLETADPDPQLPILEPVNAADTIRASEQATEQGAVLGTYAYMPPEQANGNQMLIDARADVFSLGAILCEILTGHPPYQGKTREELESQARRGDLEDAYKRLQHCGADEDLVALAEMCLQATPLKRPKNGQVVADILTAYFQGVKERQEQERLEHTRAQTRMEEERKRLTDKLNAWRFKVALISTAAMFCLLLGGVLAYIVIHAQQAQISLFKDTVASLSKARQFQSLGDAVRAREPDAAAGFYRQALATLEEIKPYATVDKVGDLRERMDSLQRELDQEVAEAADEADMVRNRTRIGTMEMDLVKRGDKVMQRKLNAQGTLPFQTGDEVQITAELKEGSDSYFYLVWIDSDQKAQPTFPAKWTWDRLPPEEKRLRKLVYPVEGGATKLPDSAPGLEVLLLLARSKPLTVPDSQKLKKIMDGIHWKQPARWNQLAVRLDNGMPTQDYGAGTGLRLRDDPVGRMQIVMDQLLEQKLANATYAICYPFKLP
jgi:serine/threonine protein kinase